MNNVLEITQDFSFNSISLANPTPLTGGSHFTKASLGNFSKNIYLQLPKCLTKQGIVRNNTKMYCDLMFNSNEKELIQWFENLEAMCQQKIYDNRNLWFHNNIEMNDIEEMINPIMRSYRSGKNILIRTYIKNSRCVAYDENENPFHLDNLKAEDYIIPLVNIDGIKFTAKDFKIEIYLTQIMVLIPQDEFEKTCLIKIENKNKNRNIKSGSANYLENSVNDQSEDKVSTDPSTEPIETNSNIQENNKDNIVLNTESSKAPIENSEVPIENRDNKNLEADDKSEKAEALEIINDKNNIEEVNLDVLDISDVSESVDLKKPNEVYYEIYKNAKKKAKDLRQNAIQAYLDAKNIKLKYNLDNFEDSDEEEVTFQERE